MTKLCTVEGCENHRATAGKQRNGNTIYRNFCKSHHNKIAERQREENAIEAGFENYAEYRAVLNEQLAIEAGFENYAEYAAFKKEELAVKTGFKSAADRRNALNEQLAIENGFQNYAEYRAVLNEQLAIENGFENYAEYATFKKEELAVNEGYANALERRNALHPYRWALKTYCENVDSRLGFRCTTTIMLSSQLEVDHIDGNPSNNAGENLQTLCGCCHTYKTLKEKDYLTPGRKALGLTY
jgi:hypothetical protein